MKIKLSWFKYLVGVFYAYFLISNAPAYAKLLKLSVSNFPYLPWLLLGWFLLLWTAFTFWLARYNLSYYRIFFLIFSAGFIILIFSDVYFHTSSIIPSSTLNLVESLCFTLWMITIAADPEFLDKRRGSEKEAALLSTNKRDL